MASDPNQADVEECQRGTGQVSHYENASLCFANAKGWSTSETKWQRAGRTSEKMLLT